jgi:hypothetical protein
VTTETSYEQTNMKIQTFIYDLNSFLAVCYLGTLNSKTRRPTEIICSTIMQGVLDTTQLVHTLVKVTNETLYTQTSK